MKKQKQQKPEPMPVEKQIEMINDVLKTIKEKGMPKIENNESKLKAKANIETKE